MNSVSNTSSGANKMFWSKINNAPAWVNEFILEVIELCKKNNIEVHHTKTNNGDMRLRVYKNGNDSQGQNFATFNYQTKNKHLIVNVKSGVPMRSTLKPCAGSGALDLGIRIAGPLDDPSRKQVLYAIENSKDLLSR